VAGWLLGVGVLSLRLLVSVAAVARLRRGRRPLPGDWPARAARLAGRLGFRTPPQVCLSARAAQALATGVLRPLVLLPAAWVSELPPDVLEAVIAHELAHLRRYDLWINLWLRVVETVLFYHPAVWWLSRRLRAERELCCDELAASAAGGRAAVAKALESVARLGLAPPPPAALATLIGGETMSLLARVRYLLGQAPAPRPAGRWLAGLLALFVPVAAWLAAGQPPAPPAPPKPDETAVGVVVDPDGRPVAGLEVMAYRGDERLPQAFRTDERGQFRVPAAWARADGSEGDDEYRLIIVRDAAGRVGWHDFFQNH
jgi:D-alanyl-D-alanine endopeptidase (penicillin-binding protein 7)